MAKTTSPSPRVQKIRIADLIVVPELDVRPLNLEHVQALEPHLDEVPPILVIRGGVFDQPGMWALIGGKHRTQAARNRRRTWIRAEEFEGTKTEAIARAWMDNSRHGIPLNRQERTQAVIELSRLGYNCPDISRMIGGLTSSAVDKIVVAERVRQATRAEHDLPFSVYETIGRIPKPYWELLVRKAAEHRWRKQDVENAQRMVRHAVQVGLSEAEIKDLPFPQEGRRLPLTSHNAWDSFSRGVESLLRFQRDWDGELPPNPAEVRFYLTQLEILGGFMNEISEKLADRYQTRLKVVSGRKEIH